MRSLGLLPLVLAMASPLSAQQKTDPVQKEKEAQRDVNDLQEDLPLRIADAIPTEGGQFQSVIRYARFRDRTYTCLFIPQLQYGWKERWLLQLQSSLLAGPGDRTGSGDISTSVLGRINKEKLFLPSFALQGQVTFPSGKGSAGIDTRVQVLASKSVSTESRHRIHFNGAWYHNNSAFPDERVNRYDAALGYSWLLTKHLVVLADAVRVQEVEGRQHSNYIEIGFRHLLGKAVVISLGGGAGIGEQSPLFRLTGGVEISLK